MKTRAKVWPNRENNLVEVVGVPRAIRSLLMTVCLSCQPSQSGAAVLSSAAATEATNAFPSLSEIFQGKTFATEFERDVFLLRSIHDRYPQHWNSLLAANISVSEYTQPGAKLLRFVEELGFGMRGTDDLVASTNLALITADPAFYANTNAYRPDIQRAAAKALMDIGPKGRAALASSFTQVHYRTDPDSLEELAKQIGKVHPPDTGLANALAATAFDFSTTNGGTYPGCTRTAVESLLCLDQGEAVVRAHLRKEAVLEDPGRFQAVIEAIAAARAAGVGLRTNLVAVETMVTNRLDSLTNSPGGYTDNLRQLQEIIRKTLQVSH